MEIEIVSGRTTISPGVVNSFSAQQIPAYWRAIEFLSANLASFPIDVHDDGSKSDKPHPLDRILKRKANSQQNSHEVLKTFYYHGEHYGNGFIFVRRDPQSNDVIGLYNLLPVDVVPYRLVPENGSLFDSEIWYWHGPSQKSFPASSILHYRPQISYDGLMGYSPSLMFQPVLARAQMLEVYQTKFLRQGSLIKGYIYIPQGAQKEQIAEIISNIGKYKASSGDRDIPVLTGGAELRNLTISPVDSDLSEQDAQIEKKIAQMTGLDPSFLFSTAEQRLNAASVEAAGQNLVRFCLRPRLELIEAEMTTKLLTEAEQDAGLTLRADTSALIRGDTAVEMTVASAGVAGGLLTRNEGREQIGEPAVNDPKADQLLVPSHVATESDSQEESESHSAQPSLDHYAAFKPLIGEACQRVDAKSQKIMDAASTKIGEDRTVYINVRAEEQSRYCREALTPIAQAIEQVTGKTIDVNQIAEKYSAELRRRAAGHEPKTLADYMGEYD